jgi:hypothetical protein
MAILFVFAVSAGAIALTTMVATLPRWCLRSIQRHRLWRCRDRLADKIISGELPQHPAVLFELRMMEASIENLPKVSFVDMLIFGWLARRTPAEAWRHAEGHTPSTTGLADDQRKTIENFHDRHMRIAVGSMMLGSWIGLLFIITQIPAALLASRRKPAMNPEPQDCDPPAPPTASAIRLATDRAASPEHRVARRLSVAFDRSREREHMLAS